MTKKRWKVDLIGPEELLVAASSNLSGQDDPWVESRDGRYFFAEHVLAHCQTPAEVRDKSKELIFQINALASTFMGMGGSLRWKDVRGIDTDGSETVFVLVQEAVAISSCRVDVVIKDQSGNVVSTSPRLPSLDQWAHLLKVDAAVKTVERLNASQASDWVNLMRIFDLIEDDLGGKDQLVAFTGSKKNRERFRHTANHPASAGDLARHSVPNGDPPRTPMTLPEARAYVDQLRVAWLRKKIDELSSRDAANA